MNTEATRDQIARNVQVWRREQKKRTTRVQVSQKLPTGEEPSHFETTVQLAYVHNEAKEFGNNLALP